MIGPSNEATGSFRVRRLEELGAVREWLHSALSAHRYGSHDTFAIRTGFEEAANNAITHGNSGDPAKAATIDLTVGQGQVDITIEDEGPGFDYSHLEDPTSDENLLKESGRGVMLIHSFMDEVHYIGPGNRVRLVKYRSDVPLRVRGDSSSP
jgi:serine/threonine-protein kinase RsbW